MVDCRGAQFTGDGGLRGKWFAGPAIPLEAVDDDAGSLVCVTVPVVRTSACLLQVGGVRGGVGEGRGSSSVRQKAVMDHFAASPFSAWGPVGIGVKKRRQCALQPKDQDRERRRKKKGCWFVVSRLSLSNSVDSTRNGPRLKHAGR